LIIYIRFLKINISLSEIEIKQLFEKYFAKYTFPTPKMVLFSTNKLLCFFQVVIFLFIFEAIKKLFSFFISIEVEKEI
jgi:hypothetical protein